ITFVSAESGRRYSEADLATAQDLARRAAISIDNARLFGDAQASRQHAQESLAVVDAVFAAAPIGLAFMDTNFRYVRVNQALAALNGLPVEEHFGPPPPGGAGRHAGRRDRAAPHPGPRDG